MADIKKTLTKLVMTFGTGADKRVSLSLDNPRVDLEEMTIKDAMQSVLDNDIFVIEGAPIANLVEAKIVITDTDEYDLV